MSGTEAAPGPRLRRPRRTTRTRGGRTAENQHGWDWYLARVAVHVLPVAAAGLIQTCEAGWASSGATEATLHEHDVSWRT
jgi:hypothetical protein